MVNVPLAGPAGTITAMFAVDDRSTAVAALERIIGMLAGKFNFGDNYNRQIQ